MSLLLDALKQAERNKARAGDQSGAAPAAPGDPKILLDGLDLELRDESEDKVEPRAADKARTAAPDARASTPRSVVTRAMQEPTLRAAAKQDAEQEIERQHSAKLLFAAKQGAHRQSFGATWIAALALGVLALVSGFVYFLTTRHGNPLAVNTSPPIKVTAADRAPQSATMQPPSSAAEGESSLPRPQTTPATPAADDAKVQRPAAAPPQPGSVADLAITASKPEAEQPQNDSTANASQGASSASPDRPARTGNTDSVAPRKPTPAIRRARQARAEPRRDAPTSDTWVMQADADQDAAAPQRPGGSRRARKPRTNAPASDQNMQPRARSALSVQRSAAAHELHPDLSAAYQALLAGNLQAAAQGYQSVLNADAFNLDAELGLATIAASQGDREGARRHYRRALELDPKNDVALAGLAGLASASGASSESGLKTRLAEQPGSHHLHFALGNDFARQRRWPEAQQSYFNAHSLDPDNPDYAYNLAVSLDQLNQPRAALSYYERAVQLSAARPAQFNPAQVSQRINELKQP